MYMGPSSWAAATAQLLCTSAGYHETKSALYTSGEREEKLHRRPTHRYSSPFSLFNTLNAFQTPFPATLRQKSTTQHEQT